MIIYSIFWLSWKVQRNGFYIMLTQLNNAIILDTFNERSMDLLGLEQVHPLFGHKFG